MGLPSFYLLCLGSWFCAVVISYAIFVGRWSVAGIRQVPAWRKWTFGLLALVFLWFAVAMGFFAAEEERELHSYLPSPTQPRRMA